jgi:hypothetical protein
MKRLFMTTTAATMLCVTFGPNAFADGMAYANPLATRSEPGFVRVDERDRGINGLATITATTGSPMLVDAGQILSPNEQAIANEGQVMVYIFDGQHGQNDGPVGQR